MKIRKGFLTYLINEEEKTASIIGENSMFAKLVIPRSVVHESIEYIVVSISERAFMNSILKSIQFDSDSELRMIEKNAFYCSNIESLEIPSHLVNLKEGWCSEMFKLSRISVSPQNPRFKCLKEKLLFGKTSIDQTHYDCLVFCARDIKKINIPKFILHISPYAFEASQQFKKVGFLDKPSLKTIGNYAFAATSIKSIRIPSSVTQIGAFAFFHCKKLKQIEILEDSKLRIIEKNALSSTKIESIAIPSQVEELIEGWCFNTPKLIKINVSPENHRYCCFDDKMILGKSSSDKDNFDSIVICVKDIKNLIIPNYIEYICSFAFYDCSQLQKVVIPSDSKLREIGRCAFSSTLIKEISIPSNVTRIGEWSFNFCLNLCKFEISADSKLQTIEEGLFYHSSIERIKIPSNITTIEDNAFYDCGNLKRVDIAVDSKLQIIGKCAFAETSIKSIIIPSEITQIGEHVFFRCKKLIIIEISEKFQMSFIDQKTFEGIEDTLLMIPATLRKKIDFFK